MQRRRRRARKKIILVLLVFFLVIFGLIGIKLWKVVSIGFQVVTNNQIELKETPQKQINMLILGVGGGTHEGPDLTDTIIFANIDPNTKKVTLVSIPRDLWVPELKAKINTAYTYGEEKEKGGGLILTKALLAKITGQEINYAVKLDFSGFVKAVDMVGGLDITVDHAFDDYQYPIEGRENDTCGHNDTEVASLSAQIASSSATELDTFPCRYEHLHFDQGPTHMDGITALKFVRSRHALGPEGSDFARSKRQEKVITAFKNKLFSLDVLLNPVKAVELINVVKDSIDTDIRESEYDDFIRLANKLRGTKIISGVLDTGDPQANRPGLLTNPPISSEYGNQWVLIPRTGNGNYSEIQQYINCEINKGECPISAL